MSGYCIKAPEFIKVKHDPKLIEIRKEIEKLQLQLLELQKEESEIRRRKTIAKKSLRRLALLEKLRKRALKEWR